MDKDDILRILTELRIDDIKVLEKNIQIPCMVAGWSQGHSEDSNHSGSMGISISPESPSLVHCFSCGFSGTLYKMISEVARHSKFDMTALLEQVRGSEEQSPMQLAKSVQRYSEEVIRDEYTLRGDCILRLMFYPGTHASFLKRGLTKETLKAWECHMDPVYRRVVLPIRSRTPQGGNCVRTLAGAVGRTYVEHPVKYYNYFGVKKAKFLYGEHLLKGHPAVVLVEGMVDTLLLWQEMKNRGANVDVLGSMGADVSDEQVRKLCQWFDEVILFPDNDSPGLIGARKLERKIKKRVLTKEVFYAAGKDPAELIARGIDVVPLIENAKLVI